MNILIILKKYAPAFYKKSLLCYKDLFNQFEEMQNISIDYAVLEKTKDLLLCPMKNLSWSDVGSWDSVYEVLEKDDNLNAISGNILDIETKNSLIIGGKRFGIASGRPFKLAEFTLGKLLDKFNEKAIVFLDEIMIESEKLSNRGLNIDLKKPNPFSLFKAAEALKCVACKPGRQIPRPSKRYSELLRLPF